jgi:cytochrome P450
MADVRTSPARGRMTVDNISCSVFDAGLPTLDYDRTTTPGELYPDLLAAQQRAPIALGPFGPEVLSHDLVRTVLRDSRFHIPPGLNLATAGVTSGPLWDKVVNTILCMEGPQHQRVRGVVSRAFTPRAVKRLHATIVEIIDGLVEPLRRQGNCDVVTDIARPYAVPVICALLGAPPEDWEQFSLWADDVFKAFSFTFTPDLEPAVMRAWGELDDYVDDMVARRRATLTDDLLSDLIRAEHDGNRLNADELRMMAAGLLLAGTDTTRNQVAASIDVLIDHPDQWQLLRDNPDLATVAVDETMRHSPILTASIRVTNEDVDIAGVVIPAGTMILANTAAANRDPAVYDDADRFDITRQGVPPILTFGAGAHYCLGANLARLEIAEALKTVTHRLANPRRTGPAPWKPQMNLTGPTTLPIAFDT